MFSNVPGSAGGTTSCSLSACKRLFGADVIMKAVTRAKRYWLSHNECYIVYAAICGDDVRADRGAKRVLLALIR